MDYMVLEKAYWSQFRVVRFQQRLTHNFGDSLILPKVFVENWKHKLGSSATLKTKNGSQWVVKLQAGENGDVLLTTGWNEFAQAHCLKKDDTVVFKYSGNFEFKVTMFDGETGGENVFGHFVKNTILHPHIVAPENQNYLNTSLRICKLEPTESNDKDGETEPQNEDCTNSCQHQRSGARSEGTESIVEEEESERRNDIWKQRQRCLRRAHALKIAKSDEHVVYLCASCVKPGYVLTVSGRWAKKHGLDGRHDVELHMDGKAWPVSVYLKLCGQAGICSGWRDFVVDNGLHEGDVCLFTVIHGLGDQITINVRIVRVVNDVNKSHRDVNGNSNGWKEFVQENCLKKDDTIMGTMFDWKTSGENAFGHFGKNIELKPHVIELESQNDLSESSRRFKLPRMTIESSDKYSDTVLEAAHDSDSAGKSQCPRKRARAEGTEKQSEIRSLWKKKRNLRRARALAIAKPNECVVYMCATYLKKPYHLHFSGKWAIKHGLDRPRDVELHMDGKTWPVIVNIYTTNGQAVISSGWRDFIIDNYLQEGDVCLFIVAPVGDHVNNINVRVVRVINDLVKDSRDVNDDSNDVNGTSVTCRLERTLCSDEDSEIVLLHEESEDGDFPHNSQCPRNRARAEGSESCIEKKQLDTRSNGPYDILWKKERQRRRARAREIAKSNDYVIYVCATYIKPPYILSLSGKWAARFVLDRPRFVELHMDGKTWPVRVYNNSRGQAVMTSGWRYFVVENDLQEGDVCLFTAVPGPGDDVVTINVRIVRVDNHDTVIFDEKNVHENGLGHFVKNIELHPRAVELESHNNLNETSRRCKLKHMESSDKDHESLLTDDAQNTDGLNDSQCPRKRARPEDTKSCSDIREAVRRGILKMEQLNRAHSLEIAKPDDYVVYLAASYVKHPYILSLSGKWGMKHGFDRPRDVELHFDGKVWPVRVFVRQTGTAGMSTGWRNFAVDNCLQGGDVCFFNVVPGLRDHITINVRIVRGITNVTKTSIDGNGNGNAGTVPEPENSEGSKHAKLPQEDEMEGS